MRRIVMLLLCITFLFLCSCGKQVQQTEADGSNVVGSAETDTDIRIDSDTDDEKNEDLPSKRKEIVVSEIYSEVGSFSIPDGSKFEYSFHVPQIDDNTPDAAAINEEIVHLYGTIVEENMKYINNQETPWCNVVSYESYCSGDVLSLVLKSSNFYEYFEEYSVYNYDTAKGKRLTNNDILSIKGVSTDEYLNAVRRAAAKCYDDWFFPAWEEFSFEDSSWAYQKERSLTLSSRNLTLNLPIYLGNDGAIHTIATIGCHAGVDWLYEPLTLDFENDTSDVETDDSLDFMMAMRQGNRLNLYLKKTKEGSRILEENEYLDMPYGKEVPVNGLYSDYTRIFCNTAGEMDCPYVFLLTKEGRVEYVDIMKCIACGYFCAGGPLLGVEDVKDFSTDTDENGLRWIYAETGSGERIELTDLTVVDQHSMEDCFSGGWSHTRTVSLDGGEEYEENIYLEFTGYGDFNISLSQSNQDYSMEADGYFTYLGMTEDGTVYAYHLWGNGSNGPGITGAVALEMWWDADGSILNITELGGTPLIGEQTGDMTSLAKYFE